MIGHVRTLTTKGDSPVFWNDPIFAVWRLTDAYATFSLGEASTYVVFGYKSNIESCVAASYSR